MRDRLTIGEGQHILIGVNQQERFQHHAVHHRLMDPSVNRKLPKL
jgi:hypothetical protein